MEFHEKLQELRKQKGLTQEELAQALFVSRTAISKWESGRGYPNIDSLKAIAKFYCVTIDELLSGEEALTIAEADGKITHVLFGACEEAGERTPLLDEAVRQLKEYFAGERLEFNLPLNPEGTEFQQKVWKALTGIPYGETRSYGEIARAIGREKACRAVGMANHNNPISIIIPCHRVVGADGSLTGYGGGLDKKRFLLKLEGLER